MVTRIGFSARRMNLSSIHSSCVFIRVGGGQYSGRSPLVSRRPSQVDTQYSTSSSRRSSTTSTSDSGGNGELSWMFIGLLASLGMVETGYLSYESLVHGHDGMSIACPLSGSTCGAVLGSSYAYLWDTIPLSLLGCVTYGSIVWMMFLRVSERIQTSTDSTSSDKNSSMGDGGVLLERDGEGKANIAVPSLETCLLWSSTLLVSTSLYLVHLLTTVFQDSPCPWCMASIGLSLSIGALVLKNTKINQLKEHVMPGAGLVFSTVFLLSLGLGNASDASGGVTSLDYKEPVVTTQSSERALVLARRLKADGAKMYGAFWCSHCYEQKQDFGHEAMKEFPYVECFPEGWSQGVSMATQCKVPLGSEGKTLQGFPTWVIGNDVFEGEQSFDALEDALKALEQQELQSGRLIADN